MIDDKATDPTKEKCEKKTYNILAIQDKFLLSELFIIILCNPILSYFVALVNIIGDFVI